MCVRVHWAENTLSFKDRLEKHNSYRPVAMNITPERGTLSASFQLCLASSRVIFLTCALCLVLINILLKRVKRSSWFTSAETRGHWLSLSPSVIYFRNLPATTSLFVVEVRCFWNTEPQKIHKVWVQPDAQNSWTWQCSYVSLKLRAGRADSKGESKLSCNFHTMFPLPVPK